MSVVVYDGTKIRIYFEIRKTFAVFFQITPKKFEYCTIIAKNASNCEVIQMNRS